MAEPALRTRIRVRFPEGTVVELDRDPGRTVGDLLPASAIGAYWAGHAKFLVRAKHMDPGSDIDPPEIRYEVEPLGAEAANPGG
ncbi:MAG: hypothetical protein FJZ01_19525 [Candidatus Sericytochromatia bacterium]|nr:hypothetical protein [Candidatus Tanganyikabacteria bacterium]